MNTIYFNSSVSDDERRAQLFNGQIFVYAPRPSVMELVGFAREFVEKGFGGLDPLTAQHEMTPQEYERILTSFKPTFINHPHSKELVQKILLDFGCDPEATYFDVPRMRTATSNQFLTRGIAYSFEAHRDTWFSGPLNQINWWFPIYDHESENTVAFHPAYWDKDIANGSEGFNCHAWDAEGRRIAQNPGTPDLRRRPQPVEPLELDPQIRVVSPVGGVTVFSAAQLHSTVPNQTGKTRWSIDFRMVNANDVLARRGAPNCDSRCTGTTLDVYYRLSDQARFSPEIIESYESGWPLRTAGQPTEVGAAVR